MQDRSLCITDNHESNNNNRYNGHINKWLVIRYEVAGSRTCFGERGPKE